MKKVIAKRSKSPRSGIAIDGFYRVNIVDPDGTLKGDSGWKHNLIPVTGMNGYITYLFGGSNASSRVGYMHLGSLQSTLATNASSLPGEYGKALMAAIAGTTYASTYPTHKVQFSATFASNGIVTASNQTIGCIGLYNTTAANSIFCGGSFASSTLGSNQAINCTYEIVFTASAS